MLDADPRRGCVVHAFEDHHRLDAVGLLCVQRLVTLIHTHGAAHSCAQKNAGTLTLPIRQFALRVRDGPPGRYHRELAHAIHQVVLRWVKMIGTVELYRGRQRHRQSVYARDVEHAYARAPRARSLEHLLRMMTQGRNNADTRDGDPLHVAGCGWSVGAVELPASAPWSATSFSINWTTSPRVRSCTA